MAPEVLLGDYDNKADMWSIGVIAFMLLSSSLPFFGKTRQHVIKKVMACQYSYKSRRWVKVSEEAKLFVSKMLQKDAKKRPSASDALDLSWLKKNIETRADEEDYVIMDRVFATIQTFANYGRLKKLALLVIAYKSSDEEIGFLRRIFRKFDKLKDGEISLLEFKEALAEYNYSDQELDIMFNGIDIDQTGKIHYSEFLAATIETHGSIDEERIAEAFDRLDSDDSGYITVQNLKSFLGDDVQEEYLDAIIDEADIVHDHRISYDEFLSLWDEADDVKLRNSLKSVSLRRSGSADSEGSQPSTNDSDDIMTVSSKISATSSEMGGAYFFGKEREKSMRGVWV
jgi:calcium-dependent protein kinase